MPLTRRGFIKSSLGAAALPALGPRLTLSATPGRAGDILICLFLRGGADGLNIIVPYADPDYYRLRSDFAIPAPGQGEGSALDLDGFFGLHPAMAPLLPAFTAAELAIVHATGSPHETRSHFDAMDFMERAYLEKGGIFSGWIGRHLEAVHSEDSSPFRAMGMGNAVQTSLRGEVPAVAISDIEQFDLVVRGNEQAFRAALIALYDGTSALDIQARQALDAAALLREADPLQYPPENGAVYPQSPFGQMMLQIAQLLKAETLGVEVACADLGGWDTHEGQDARLDALLADLAAGLNAFYTDMGVRMGYITVVVMSEFGRRAYPNASGGTDHGHGNCLLALGGGVNGARVFADWPGLAEPNLYGNGDLQVTTDWRTVLGELVARRLGNQALETVFPDYSMPEFLGVFRD